MMTVDREHISGLLEYGWSVVGYTTQHHEMLETDDVERISHKLLLQKGSALRVLEIHFDGHDYATTFETVLAPGKSS